MSAPPQIVEIPAETLQLSVAAITDAAGREQNQDVAVAIPIDVRQRPGESAVYLLVVADGMGGHPSGDVASRIAVETLREALPYPPRGDLGQALKHAYRRANEAVFEAGQNDPVSAGMGTTLTSAILHGKYATIANVGDSRAYLLRGNGLTQVTRDHTLVADEAASGRISADAARRDPRRNVLTHVIGAHPKLDTRLPNIFELTLLPGDRLLLCSDGLYDVLDDVDMQRTLLAHEPFAAAAELVALAKERGTSDNATAVVAAAVPTRVPVAAALPSAPSRTGGLAGTTIAAAVAVLLIVLLILAVFLLGFIP